jgi:nucleoside-diphosphate-sugar epimerase
MSERLLVTGAGGFIGGHLVANLLREGNEVRAVDIKPLQEWYQLFPEAENLQLDLCGKDACERAVRDVSLIYNLAADMGGMGFIENNKALCMLSVLVNTHMLMMAKKREFRVSSTPPRPVFTQPINKPIRTSPL